MTTRSKSGIIKSKKNVSPLFKPIDSPTETEPTSYKEAAKHLYWQKAMDEEFNALQQ